MTKHELLKEMNACEARKEILRKEIRAEKDILAMRSKIEELESLSNRIFELNSMYQISLLGGLQEELKGYLGL